MTSKVRILVVDDEYDKVKRIVRALSDTGLAEEVEIDDVRDVVSARRRMVREWYDLLITDLNVPFSRGAEVEKNAGLELIRGLEFEMAVERRPTHIVGVTAHTDAFESVKEEFAKRMWPVLLCPVDASEWLSALCDKVRYIRGEKNRRKWEPLIEKVDVGIVTALFEPEFKAVLGMGFDLTLKKAEGDTTAYYLGRTAVGSGKISIAGAVASEMGLTAASSLVTKMIYNFKPDLILMPGIMAGVRGKTNIGDVVVGCPVWDWGSGKLVKEDGKAKLKPAPDQVSLRPATAELLKRMSHDQPLLDSIKRAWKGSDTPDYSLRMHVGPVASGAAVLANPDVPESIKEQHRKLLTRIALTPIQTD